MNFKSIALLLAGSAAFSAASAQSIHLAPSLQTTPEIAAPVRAPFRAPLNADRAKGTKIFGASISNGNRTPVYFNIYTADPNKIEVVSNIKTPEDEANDQYNIMSLASASSGGNGVYYAFKAKKYSNGATYPVAFEKINPADGSITLLRDMSQLGANWTNVYSLAYNPADSQLYGLVVGSHTGADGGVASSIVKIDKASGALIGSPKPLKGYYYAIAFDYDGKLWGVSWLTDGTNITGNKLDVINPADGSAVSSNELRVEGRAFIGYYQHGLGFDYTTGDLYWFATNAEGSQYLVRVNPDNASTEKLGPTGYANIAVGPHIEYRTADSRTAPAIPTDLSFTVDPEGADKVTLNWTNPTITWNRAQLSDLANVNIYRDNLTSTPVATLPATAGDKMSWTDADAPRGIHTYYIIGVNAAGQKGVSEHLEAFVGRDVPGPVSALTASTSDGKKIVVKWDLPTRGDNDGWYDKSSLTYTVVRFPGEVTVAKDITATEFTDETLAQSQSYSYEVTASNADGTGTPAATQKVIAGNSVSIPFSLDFRSQVNAGRFTVIDRNMDGQKFEWDINTNDEPYNAMKLLLSEQDNDDLLVTPALIVHKDKSYKVEYTVSFGRMTGAALEDHYHHLAITAGDAATAEAQQTVQDFPQFLVPNMYHRTKVTGFFKAPHDGDYFVGLDILTKGEKLSWVYIEDFSIVELSDFDLEATSVTTGGLISTKSDNSFEVSVFNASSTPVKDYTVDVAVQDAEGNPYIVASTSSVPEIGPKATEVVKLSGFNPNIPTGNGYLLYATAHLEGDNNTDNDMTPAKPVRVVAGSTVIATGSDRQLDTRIPICFYEKYSATQIIYTPKMTGLGDIPTVSINGIGVPYTSERDIKDFRVQIHFSTPGYRDGFGEDEYTWVTDNSVKAFDGNVTINKGEGLLFFEFPHPYEYTGSDNLAVSFNTLTNPAAGSYPVKFAVYDTNWNNPVYHSGLYKGGTPFNVDNPNTQYVYTYPFANELYMIIDNNSGINEIASANRPSLSFDSAAGTISAPVVLTAVSVYNLQGQLVKTLTPNADTANLALPAGAYIITAKDAAGNHMIIKALAH